MAQIIPPSPVGSPFGSYTWSDWYEKVRRAINDATSIDLAGGTVVGILPVAKGGTGTGSPNLVAGTNVTITGTWPNQTINSTAGGGITTSRFDPAGVGTVDVSRRDIWDFGSVSVCKIRAAGITVKGTGSRTVGGANYYFEMQCDSDSNIAGLHIIGVVDSGVTSGTYNSFVGNDVHGWGYYAFDGSKYHNAVNAVYGSSYNTGVANRDYIGVYIDTSGNLTFYKNGVGQGVAYTIAVGTVLYPAYSSGSGAGTRSVFLNTGSQAFAYPVGGATAWG